MFEKKDWASRRAPRTKLPDLDRGDKLAGFSHRHLAKLRSALGRALLPLRGVTGQMN